MHFLLALYAELLNFQRERKNEIFRVKVPDGYRYHDSEAERKNERRREKNEYDEIK